MNNELVKPVNPSESINKNKNYKFGLKTDKEKNYLGFDNLLKEEMDKLKTKEETIEETKKYYLMLKDIYERERKTSSNRYKL